jgi:tellurite methyltransferase
MSEVRPPDPPSPFVERYVQRLSAAAVSGPGRRRALDVAMGKGRHTVALAAAGWDVFAVDADHATMTHTIARMHSVGHRVRAWCADLTSYPLPEDRFELIVVTRYLQRDLFAALRAALTPGGAVIYETFTTAQRAHHYGPTSPEHLLVPGELRARFAGFDVLFDEEVTGPDAYARFCGRKPG